MNRVCFARVVGPTGHPADEIAWARARLTRGSASGDVWEINASYPEARLSLGTESDAGWPIQAVGVRPVHCELFWDGRALWVSDVHKVGGVFLDGQRVRDWVQIHGPAELRFGQAALDIETSAPAVAKMASEPMHAKPVTVTDMVAPPEGSGRFGGAAGDISVPDLDSAKTSIAFQNPDLDRDRTQIAAPTDVVPTLHSLDLDGGPTTRVPERSPAPKVPAADALRPRLGGDSSGGVGRPADQATRMVSMPTPPKPTGPPVATLPPGGGPRPVGARPPPPPNRAPPPPPTFPHAPGPPPADRCAARGPADPGDASGTTDAPARGSAFAHAFIGAAFIGAAVTRRAFAHAAFIHAPVTHVAVARSTVWGCAHRCFGSAGQPGRRRPAAGGGRGWVRVAARECEAAGAEEEMVESSSSREERTRRLETGDAASNVDPVDHHRRLHDGLVALGRRARGRSRSGGARGRDRGSGGSACGDRGALRRRFGVAAVDTGSPAPDAAAAPGAETGEPSSPAPEEEAEGEGQSIQRRAADAYRTGRLAEALVLYRRLAEEAEEGDTVYATTVRILEREMRRRCLEEGTGCETPMP